MMSVAKIKRNTVEENTEYIRRRLVDYPENDVAEVCKILSNLEGNARLVKAKQISKKSKTWEKICELFLRSKGQHIDKSVRSNQIQYIK